MNDKAHWENVYAAKTANEVSWFQEYPKTAVDYIEALALPKTAKIVDVGGGDSNLAASLLELGYNNIWVVDISTTALKEAKIQLGKKAASIHWIVSDITEWETDLQFDFWYDRAVFHFLTDSVAIQKYIALVNKAIVHGGNFLLGTFSAIGPLKCSGLEIKQYSEETMRKTFLPNFEAVQCFTENHTTPFNTVQHFQFCGFKKLVSTENFF